MQESFNTRFSFKIFILKITFSSCLFIAQSKTLSYVAEIFLSVRVLSVLSCVSVNIAITCKRNVILTMKSIIASSVCILIANAILFSWWWSEKESRQKMIAFFMSCWTFTSKCKKSLQELLICKINLWFWRTRNRQWLNKSFKTSLSSRKMREKLASHCWMIFSLTCFSSRLKFYQTLTDWVSQLKLSQKHLTVLKISLRFSSVLNMFIIFSLD